MIDWHCIELHCHTNESDGDMTPTRLVDRASERGYEAIALTDHNTISGVEQAVEYGASRGLVVVKGIEWTTFWGHIVVTGGGSKLDWRTITPNNIDDCIASPEPFLSTLVGRYGNRICHGKFSLNGKEYSLAINNGPNHLHGGPTGFHARVWDAEQINEQTLVLRYISPYYEEGFTGELSMTVMYSLTEDNELKIDYKGTTNKKTIVNMTSHGFFSLAGIANPTPVYDDVICQINADFYIPIDENSIPTGEIRSVKGTPFDFTTPHTVGERIDADDEQIKNGAG